MKKLIETAIPLDVINKASSTEKSIRHGHPSTLHLWWARRPLATARAVLFASLIDDPAEHPDKFPTPEAQQAERERLFKIIGKLVKWENSGNEKIFAEALAEIKASVGDDLPAVFDPFAGGGTIPLEAQRLGLKAYAADMNPVAVMINKAMIELPAKFKAQPPVNPDKDLIATWHGAQGLAADVLYYGKLLKAEALNKIGKFYPKIDGKTVIAWLWARTVTCSNPACQHTIPLVHSFKLSTKQKIFVQPIIDGDKIRFEIRTEDKEHTAPEGTVNRNGARCLFCGTNVPLEHVRNQGKAGNLGAQLMAIVAEGDRGRIYLAPDELHEKIADVEKPDDYPEQEMNKKCPDLISGRGYGFNYWHQLFTNRQLTALTTFSNLINKLKAQVIDDGGSKDYADALIVYLTFLVDKLADYNSSFCSWHNSGEKIRNTFGRQAIPMNWDFAETNPFSTSSGCFDNMLDWIYKSVNNLPGGIVGEVMRHNALEKFPLSGVMVSSDPPYYDNIGYADLSEFFYVWMRRTLKSIYPQLFGRMTFDKVNELIATPYRHNGSKAVAKKFFEDGMSQALQNIYDSARADFPVTIYYAFKQQEAEIGGAASTGWETMLTALIKAGFQITATLPMRTEMTTRTVAHESNALASSVVLVCRKRPPENKICDKHEFLRLLQTELKTALADMQKATIAPVDMAQAAIGPGIGVYSRYDKITDMTDTALTIRDALKIINTELAKILGDQPLDMASQFCVDLFTQSGFNEIVFGDADNLARAKNISVGGLEDMGAVKSSRGQVRLTDRDEMPILDENKQLKRDWLDRLIAANCAWLWVQSLVYNFKRGGIKYAAELIAKCDGDLDSLKNLAYRLYNICEQKNWAREATGYNDLVTDWQDILSDSVNYKQTKLVQGEFEQFKQEAAK